jgi:glyceraldehyde 3-phosphate dehydrogenase
MRIAINGFGRIGRTTLRALQNKENIQVVAINDLTQVDTLAHLLKYDTAHGRFPGEITIGEGTITVNRKQIKMLSERDPAKLPWKALAVDVVIESTGRFTDKDAALQHVDAGRGKNHCAWGEHRRAWR